MLIGIISLLLLLIALLAIPVRMTFHVSRRQRFQGEIELCWLFGLACIRFDPFRASPTSREDKPGSKKIDDSQAARGKSRRGTGLFKHKAFRSRLLRFVRDFWHAVHKQNIILRVRIGLGDPADTGQLWALAGPLAGFLANCKEAYIELEPDFIDTVFELDSSGTIRFVPLQLLILALGMLLSLALWQGLNQMRSMAT